MARPKSIQYSLAVLFFLMVSIIAAKSAYGKSETEIYGAAESFTWKEFNDSGARLLKESGPLVGAGMSYAYHDENFTILRSRGELFGSRVDYDGQTQSGVPVVTKTGYFGFKVEGDFGKKFMVGAHSSLEPFGGVGYRWWIRDIRNGTDVLGNPVSGYREVWQSLYLRLGVRADHGFSDQRKIFGAAGVKLPLDNSNTAYLSNINSAYADVTLKPRNEASLFAETGVNVRTIKVTAFYESFRFSKSPIENAGAFGPVIQPDTKADILGLRVGVVF